VSHSDGRLDLEGLSGFISAYQSDTVLKLGELWAIPTMLRLALLENLRRVGATMVIGTIDRISADYWADKLTKVAQEKPTRLITVIGEMVKSIPAMSNSFVAEFTRRLQGKGSSPGIAGTLGRTAIARIRTDDGGCGPVGNSAAGRRSGFHQQQHHEPPATRQEGLARICGIHQRRREHPAAGSGGCLPEDGFCHSRPIPHAVEDTAKRSGQSEEAVATDAIQKALRSRDTPASDCRTHHVGFHLVPEHRQFLRRGLYFGSIASIAAALVAFLLWQTDLSEMNTVSIAALGLLAAICAVQPGISVVNWMTTLILKPEKLPRMDFSKGIPGEFRTLVVIPTLLTNSAQIDQLVDGLEVRYLANREENLYFGS
jgi:hypothetical protein